MPDAFFCVYDSTQVLQKRDQLTRGLATVADGVFHFVAQLGKGQFVAVGLEDGVVAEAIGTALLLGDVTVATAFEEIGLTVKVQRDASTEGCLAVGLPLHGSQHLVDVVLVGAMLTGITGRIDAWGAAQGLHLEAGVVGETVHMVLVGDEVRLDLGVAFNGVGVFNDVLVTADVFEAQDLIEAFHDFAHLAQLVFVIGGEDDLFHFSLVLGIVLRTRNRSKIKTKIYQK